MMTSGSPLTGVKQDGAKAVLWYYKAAEQGEADAQCSLAMCLETGNGVVRDKSESLKWYRKAAEQGYGTAQFNLGTYFFKGDGVPKDYVQAHVWWNLAAAQDYDNAREKLAILEKDMTPDQKAEAMKVASQLFQRAAKN